MPDEVTEQETNDSEENSKDDGTSTTTNKKSKDSVFVNLFKDNNYVLRLYKELHPKDTKVTLDDINVTTLKTILVNNIYNDLGFIVNENGDAKFGLLVEAQSAWNPNMTLRMLFYISETYHRYLKQSAQNVHLSTRVKIPKPELYVVYTGDRKAPDEISFKDDYFNGNSPIDLKVTILSKTDVETIHGQYIGFCRVYNEQRKIYDNSIDCIKETIKICIEKGYLSDFLSEHKTEVFTMMSELFDEQAQREAYDEAIKKQMIEMGEKIGEQRGEQRGKQIGEKIGEQKKMLDIALNLLALGTVSKEDIAKATGFTLEKIKELAAQGRPAIA